MASSDSPSVGSSPWEAINSTDQGGLIAILSAFALSLPLLSVPIRIYIRHRTGSGYKADDYAFLAATTFAIIQAALVFYQLSKGLGKSDTLLSSNDITLIQKGGYASDIVYVFTIFLSKMSTACLFLRLTPQYQHFMVICSTITVSSIWAIISIILVATRCHLSHPWTDTTSSACTHLFSRWAFIGSCDMITEIALFAISIFLVLPLRMPLKSKYYVVGTFSCRLPVIAFAGLRIYFLNVETSSSNPTLVGTSAISCAQFEIGYGIMASIIPCLRTFIMPFEKAPAGYYTHHTAEGAGLKLSALRSLGGSQTHTSGQDNGSSIPHDSVDRERTEAGGYGSGGTLKTKWKLRPEETVYQARVTHTKREDSVGKKSMDSGNSKRMIIKKETDWSVDYEGPAPGSSGREDGDMWDAERRDEI